MRNRYDDECVSCQKIIEGTFVSTSSELPDISIQNSTKAYQKGQKSEYFSEKMTSGNTETTFFVGVW